MEEKEDPNLEVVFKNKDELFVISIPKSDTEKLIYALYNFCLDNKINATITKTKPEILN